MDSQQHMTPPGPGEEAPVPDGAADATPPLQAQIFRYADDLNELMGQHLDLQRRHRALSQSCGRGDQASDVLVSVLRDKAALYLVTDDLGEIGAMSGAAKSLLAESRHQRRPLHIWQICHPSAVAEINAVLSALSGVASSGAIEQRRMMLLDVPNLGVCDVLAVPTRKFDRVEVYWVFGPTTAPGEDEIARVVRLLNAQHSQDMVMVTSPSGDIEYVNAAFSKTTGYADQQVLKKNPRLLSAGRHPRDFYRHMWSQLTDFGVWTGELFNRQADGRIYTEWKIIRAIRNGGGDTVGYVSAAYDVASRASEQREYERQANYDALTDLPNRRLLDDRLRQAIAVAARSQGGLFLMMVDLDRFKGINDLFGHDVGDQILKVVAARMRGGVRDSDTVARLGGDEFVIILHGSIDANRAEGIASALLKALRAPIELGGRFHDVTASIGCARYPEDGQDPSELLKKADAAMFGAKRFGLEFAFYDPGEDPSGGRDLSLDLWQALERGQLHLVYQPQVSAKTGQALRGCEVLMRWHHPSIGWIAPETFIPIAERSGAIVEISNWALGAACQQMQAWRQAGAADLTLSVRVTPRQIQEARFVARLTQLLADTALPASQLELELSEADALHCLVRQPEVHSGWRALGVRISVVDFNGEHIALEQLSALRVNRLRINRRFLKRLVQSQDAQAVVQGFFGIGQALGLEVTATCVEDMAQLNTLMAHGCEVVQGYLTGMPMSAPEFEAWMRERQPQGDLNAR